MKVLITIALLTVLCSCSTPNDSASTRVSPAPVNNDPAVPARGAGARAPYNNRIQQTTGTSPAPAALPDNNTGGTGAYSTARK